MGAPTYRSGRMARAGAAVAPVVVAVVAMLIALVMHGCGESASSDCTTKATCPDDAAGPEVSMTDRAAAEVGAADGGDVGSGCNGLCANPPPMGWQGPIALYTGNAMGGPLPAPPVCPAPYSNDAVDGNAQLLAPAAQCACTCDAVTGADCSAAPTWFLYSDANCATAPCGSATTPLTMPTGCQPNSCGSSLSFKAVPGPPGLQAASCAPNAKTMLPAWSWQAVVRGCGYAGPSDPTGCTGGALCVPGPPAAFGTTACIYAPGDQPCPAGPYSTKTTVYTSETDTRSCGTCTCAAPSNVTCGVNGDLATYTLATCSGTASLFAVDAVCHAAAGTAGVEGTLTSAGVVGGSCAPTSAGPTGAVTPTGATTVCCTP